MFGFITLAFAWGLFLASVKVFPKLEASVSTASNWGTILFFKPVHLLLSFLCFLAALLLIRSLTVKCGKLLFNKGGMVRISRLFGLTYLVLGLSLLSLIAISQPLPTGIIGGVIIAFDLVQYLAYTRKKKRLLMAFRQLQKERTL